MKLRQLLEEYKTTIRGPFGKAFEIFVNPTKKELRDLEKDNYSVRYIVDYDKEKLYVFSSNLLHASASEALHIPYNPTEWRKFYFGGGEIDKRKILFYIGDYKFSKAEKKLTSQNWLKKYIKVVK